MASLGSRGTGAFLIALFMVLLVSTGLAQRDVFASIAALREDSQVKFSHKIQRMTGPTCQAEINGFMATSPIPASMATCYLGQSRDYSNFIKKFLDTMKSRGWTVFTSQEVPNGYGIDLYSIVYSSSRGMLSVTVMPDASALVGSGRFMLFVALMGSSR